LNISRFQARPGTEAAKMEQINGRITKDRSRILTDIFLNTASINNERWLDWTGTVIIDEKGKENTMVGRNFAYKPVIVEGSFKLGDLIKVKVEKTTPHDLRAKKIE
jgi:tRNA A37 methylthiotransferase MiaB